jgi:hypothetical protein
MFATEQHEGIFIETIIYVKGQYKTTVLKQNKIDATVSTFVFISSWWLCYMFRRFSWVILRRM